jgi:2-succinyl-6-hydroxy-2,4-cyclohexadiene-1-carboxylate synthase
MQPVGNSTYSRPESRRTGAAAAALLAALVAGLLASACTPAARNAAVEPPRIERETGFATAEDGVRIYYERSRARADAPTVVLVHGLGGNHAVWYRQVPRLAERYSVVTLSQRGFAPSGGDRKALDPNTMVGDLVAVLDALDIERAHLVGQSMGGWTVLGVALAVPERVRSLVLADTTGGIFDHKSIHRFAKTVAQASRLTEKPPPLGRHPALDEAFSSTHRQEAYLYQLLTTFGAPVPRDVVDRLGQAEPSRELLAANRVPTLFVVGARDEIFPPWTIERASALLASSKVTVIDDAGHSPYYECPERWAKTVGAFLAAHDAD